eukprot:3056333-Amphidinium_carterae.1
MPSPSQRHLLLLPVPSACDSIADSSGDNVDTAFGSSAYATTREPDMSYALLDSCAAHLILNLSKLTQEGQQEGMSIGIRLAAGKQV